MELIVANLLANLPPKGLVRINEQIKENRERRKMKRKLLYLLAIILISIGDPTPTFSNNEIHTETLIFYDHPEIQTNRLVLNTQNELRPRKNDFQLLDMAFMSNKIGERWSIITIKNLATGRRSLKNDYLVATFADGSQCNAHDVNVSFKGEETLTISAFWGIHKFPLVRIQSE